MLQEGEGTTGLPRNESKGRAPGVHCLSGNDRRSVDRARSGCDVSSRDSYWQWIRIGNFIACLIVASWVDALTRNRVADLDRREGRRPLQPLRAAALVGAAFSAGPGDDVELIKKLAEFQMTRGVIANYHVNAEARALEIRINPTTPLPTGEAGATGRKTCALGREDLGTKLTHPWTVRVFINSQATQAFTCQIDAARASFSAPAPPRASATVSRERLRPRLIRRQR